MEMEEAMNEFAGKAGVEDEEEQSIRQQAECVIIGYHTPFDEPDEITSIIVAGPQGKQLVVYGTIGTGIDDDSLRKIRKTVTRYPRTSSFLETNLKANWVEPNMLCMVSFTVNKKKEKRNLKFERLTGRTNIAKRYSGG